MTSPIRPETLQFDQLACITIQGGGIYGLSLLGQMEAVRRHGFSPVALAGTSAGAIVATLFWARLTPVAVLERILDLADQGRLIELVGPFERDDDGETITPMEAMQTVNDIRDIAGDLNTTARDIERIRKAPGWFRLLLSWTPWLGGAMRLRLGQASSRLRRVRWSWRKRGVFKGEALQDFLNDLLLRSPAVQDNLGLLPREVQTGKRWLTFRDFAIIQEQGHKRGVTEERPYFPPLFLAATEVSTRRLEVINSIEPRYQDWPVVQAVRASAGFPGFFMPVDRDVMEPDGCRPNECLAGGERTYVDGGVIANFPAFIFGNRFRRWLAATAPNRFHINVMRAWAHVGLRLTTPHQERPRAGEGRRPETFLSAMMDLFRGLARNELEDRIAEFVPRSVTVELAYPDTGGPAGVLAVDALRPHVVQTMYDQGLNAGERCLRRYRFNLPPANRIEPLLNELIERAESLFSAISPGQFKFRSNLFLPQGNEFVLLYRANMDDPEVGPVTPAAANTDRNFRMPIKAGLTGLCYIKRRPLLLGLAQFAQVMQQPGTDDHKEDRFHFDEQMQGQVRKDRTWLLSVPVFDPEASSPGRLPLQGIEARTDVGIMPRRWNHAQKKSNSTERCSGC